MSVLDTLKSASKARRTVSLILNAELADEWERLKDDLDDAARKDEQSGSMKDPYPETRGVLERMEELREQVAASEVTFEFGRMEWVARAALQSEHPPRPNNLLDKARGYNAETFVPALIRASCLSVTDTSGDTTSDVPDEVWDSLFATLSLRQVQKLHAGATQVNDEETQVPFSARSLLESQAFGASLAQPEPGPARPRSASKGGSRRGSAKSSATKKDESPES